MSHAALHHAVNGFFDCWSTKPAPVAAPVSRASHVRVESRYNEGDDESLLESATSLPRPTLKALEKSIRADGFKGAQVSGWGQGQRGGFTVHYGGQEYEFEISENVTPRPVGEIGQAVKASGRYSTNGRGIYHGTAAGKNDMVLHQDHRGRWRVDLVTSTGGTHTDITGPNKGYDSAVESFEAALDAQHTRNLLGKGHIWIQRGDGSLQESGGARDLYPELEHNGRRTGILSDGTRVNAYLYGNEWTAAVHYPDGGYTSLTLSNLPRGMPEFDVHNVEGSHMGRLVPWEAVPSDIRSRIEQTVAGESMVANARGTVADEDAAHELDLYIANTYELVGAPNSPGKSIDANLQRKLTAGTYDSALAPKAWQYLVDEGAKRYQKEFGSGSPIFNAATRRQVAADFARAWEQENGMTPNAHRVPAYMQGYEDWSYEDFYQDAIDDGRSRSQARLAATTSSHAVGRLGFLPPRNLPKGWVLVESPIFRRRDAKPAFWGHKGTKYMVFGLDGKPISPELNRLRGLIEWEEANGWVSAR